MGNKQGTISCAALKGNHRADTRSKNWSFHAMDGRRYPGMAARSSTKSDLLIGCGKGQSSLLHEAKGPSPHEVPCTGQKVLTDEKCSEHLKMPYAAKSVLREKKDSTHNKMSCAVDNVHHKTKCPTHQEMPSTSKEFIYEHECPTRQKIPCRTKNNCAPHLETSSANNCAPHLETSSANNCAPHLETSSANNCAPHLETYNANNCAPHLETSSAYGHALQGGENSQAIDKVSVNTAEATSTDSLFYENVGWNLLLEGSAESAFESQLDIRRGQDTREKRGNAITPQKSDYFQDQHSQFSEESSEVSEKLSATSSLSLALLDFNYALKEVDPWGRQSGNRQRSEDNDVTEELGFRQFEESDSFDDNVEDLWIGQSGTGYSFNDHIAREDSGFGQLGDYHSFNVDTTKDDVWFGQSGKYHSFNYDTSEEDLEFEMLEKYIIHGDTKKWKLTNETAINADLSRETSVDSSEWPVIERESDFAQIEILNSSPKRRTNVTKLATLHENDLELNLTTRIDNSDINRHGSDDKDVSYQGGDVQESHLLLSESEELQITVDGTSSALTYDTKQLPGALLIVVVGTRSEDSSEITELLKYGAPSSTSLAMDAHSTTSDRTHIVPLSNNSTDVIGIIKQAAPQQEGVTDDMTGGEIHDYVTSKSADAVSGDSIETLRTNASIEFSPLSDLSSMPYPCVDLSLMKSLQISVSPMPSSHLDLSPNRGDLFPIGGDLSPIPFPHMELSRIPFPHKYLSPIKVSHFRDLSSTPISSPPSPAPALSPISGSKVARVLFSQPEYFENLPSLFSNQSSPFMEVATLPRSLDSGSYSLGTVTTRTASNYDFSVHLNTYLPKCHRRNDHQTDVDITASLSADHKQTKTYKSPNVVNLRGQLENGHRAVNMSPSVHKERADYYKTNDIDAILSNHRQPKEIQRATCTETVLPKDRRQLHCDHIPVDSSSSLAIDHTQADVAQRTENIDQRPLHRLKLDFENSSRTRIKQDDIYPRLASQQQLEMSLQCDVLDNSIGKHHETPQLSSPFHNCPDNSQSKPNFCRDIISPNIIVNTVTDLGRHQGLMTALETNQLSEYYSSKLSCTGQGVLNFNTKITMTTTSTATTPTASDSGYGTGTSFTSFDQGGRTPCHDVSFHGIFSKGDDSLDGDCINGDDVEETPFVPSLTSGDIWNIFENYQWWKNEEGAVEIDRNVENSEEKLSFHPETKEMGVKNSGLFMQQTDIVDSLTVVYQQSGTSSLNETDRLGDRESDSWENVEFSGRDAAGKYESGDGDTSFVLDGSNDSGVSELSIKAIADKEPFHDLDAATEIHISESSQNCEEVWCETRKKAVEALVLPSIFERGEDACDVPEGVDSSCEINRVFEPRLKVDKYCDSFQETIDTIDSVSQASSLCDEEDRIWVNSLHGSVKENINSSLRSVHSFEKNNGSENVLHETNIISQADDVNGSENVLQETNIISQADDVNGSENVLHETNIISQADDVNGSENVLHETNIIGQADDVNGSENVLHETNIISQADNVNGSVPIQTPINLCVQISTRDFPALGRSTSQSQAKKYHRSLSLSAITQMDTIFIGSDDASIKNSNKVPKYACSLSRSCAFSRGQLKRSVRNKCISAENSTNTFSSSTSREYYSKCGKSSFSSCNRTGCFSEEKTTNSFSSCDTSECPSSDTIVSSDSRDTSECPSSDTIVSSDSRDTTECPSSDTIVSSDSRDTTECPSSETIVSSDSRDTSECPSSDGIISSRVFPMEMSPKTQSVVHDADLRAMAAAIKDAGEINDEEISVEIREKMPFKEQQIQRNAWTHEDVTYGEADTDEDVCADLTISSNLTTNYPVVLCKETNNADGRLTVEVVQNVAFEQVQDRPSGKIAQNVTFEQVQDRPSGKITQNVTFEPVQDKPDDKIAQNVTFEQVQDKPGDKIAQNVTFEQVQDKPGDKIAQNVTFEQVQDKPGDKIAQNVTFEPVQDKPGDKIAQNVTFEPVQDKPGDKIAQNVTFEQVQDKPSGKIAMGMAGVCIRRYQVGHKKVKETEPALLSAAVRSSISSPDISASHSRHYVRTDKRPPTIAPPADAFNRSFRNSAQDLEYVSPVKQPSETILHKERKRANIPVHYLSERHPRLFEHSHSIQVGNVSAHVNHHRTSVPASPAEHTRINEMLQKDTRLCYNKRRNSQSHDETKNDIIHSKNWNIARQRRSLDIEQLHKCESSILLWKSTESGCFTIGNEPGINNVTPSNEEFKNSTSSCSELSVFDHHKKATRVSPSYSPTLTSSNRFNMPMSRASISLPPPPEEYNSQNINLISDRSVSVSAVSHNVNQDAQSCQYTSNSTTLQNGKPLTQKQVTKLIHRRNNSENNISSRSERWQCDGDACSHGRAGHLYQPDNRFGWHQSRDRKFNPPSKSASRMSNPHKTLMEMSNSPNLAAPSRSCSVEDGAYSCETSSNYGGAQFLEADCRARVLRREPEHIPGLVSVNVCPACLRTFDTGKRRKLIDSCGHHRCFSCLFRSDTCPFCTLQEPRSPSPPHPDVAQHDLKIRLGLLCDPKTSQ